MNQLGLFSGIGGFELAGKEMGWNLAGWCEKDKLCRKVLKYWFPNANEHDDITTADFSSYKGRLDLISGGFPCQPFSVSGKRRGTADSRNLWPFMLNAVQQAQPRWVVAENVRGLLSWENGLVFEDIQASLEASGYQTQAFLLPASAVGAGHERYRLFFVAHNNSQPKRWPATSCAGASAERVAALQEDEQRRPRQTVFNTGLHDTPGVVEHRRFTGGFPTAPILWSPNDGFPRELVGITLSKWVKFCNKSFGNAVHVDVALNIFKAIEIYENGL